MKTSHIAALGVAVVAVVWLASGELSGKNDPVIAPPLAEDRAALRQRSADAPVAVRARVLRAQVETADLLVRGHTEADRSIQVRAQTSGPIRALPVVKGDHVEAGDVLCEIDPDTRPARIAEAREALNQARIEYEGTLELAERGFQSDTAIASARARLAAREADLAEREENLADTLIRAPFAGIVESLPTEVGDLLQSGSECATLVDPDPMMLVGEVSEREVGQLRVGGLASGRLLTGEEVDGEIVFVAQRANPATRTFRIEVAVPNADLSLRDGITTELRLPVRELPMHHIPAALLALDDVGEIGVRIVDAANRVRFLPVEMVKDTANGVWVTGLPDPARIITVGQELVTAGTEVAVTWEASPTFVPEEVIAEPSSESLGEDSEPPSEIIVRMQPEPDLGDARGTANLTAAAG